MVKGVGVMVKEKRERKREDATRGGESGLRVNG